MGPSNKMSGVPLGWSSIPYSREGGGGRGVVMLQVASCLTLMFF